MTIDILNLDKEESFTYVASTPLEAMEKHLYYLNVSAKDSTSKIEKSKRFLFLDHKGNTYCTPISQ